MTTAWRERKKWSQIAHHLPAVKSVYQAILENNESAYDQAVQEPWLTSRAVEGLLTYVQLGIAGYSNQVFVKDSACNVDDLHDRFLVWPSFVVRRADVSLLKPIIQQCLTPSGERFIQIDDHWDYITRYMATVVGLGAFGLSNHPQMYGSWETLYDTIITVLRKDYRKMLAQRFFAVRA
jgi:hypothetical protein